MLTGTLRHARLKMIAIGREKRRPPAAANVKPASGSQKDEANPSKSCPQHLSNRK